GSLFLFFFFFQAEDGIRDGHVTGVQTCALPISSTIQCHRGGADGKAGRLRRWLRASEASQSRLARNGCATRRGSGHLSRSRDRRSEERRVGKECRSGWWPYQ